MVVSISQCFNAEESKKSGVVFYLMEGNLYEIEDPVCVCPGCGVVINGLRIQNALTNDQFIEKMESAGYQIADATEQFEEGSVEAVTIAFIDDNTRSSSMCCRQKIVL
jgi:hypothetical protein